MKEFRTESGFAYQLDENIATDWDVLEALTKIVDSDTNYAETMKHTFALAKLLLGEDVELLKAHCMNVYGNKSVENMTSELVSLLTNSDAKN